MGKPSRSKKPNGFGKGKVTPIQVAFIVDRYLSDNSFTETRSLFRQEAASLIAKSPVQEAPKSLLSLSAMLNEYICLKEQKVMVEQERARMEQEKFRVHALLQGMQDVMTAYNATANIPTPLIQSAPAKPTVVLPQSGPASNVSPSGCPMYNTPPVMPISLPSNTRVERENFPPSVAQSCPLTRKRRAEAVTAGTAASKKIRSNYRKLTIKGSELSKSDTPVNSQAIAQSSSAILSTPADRSLVQTSSVAKCLFNRHVQSPPSNSPGPKTPPQPTSSQSDKSISPPGGSSAANCSNNNTPQNVTPTNRTVISSERIMVSPLKNGTYYSVERRHCISSSPAKTPSKRLGKRDHVKGRLDFDGSDVALNVDKSIDEEIPTSESDKDADIFDLDLPNLDALGPDFSFSELLVDLGIDCEGLGCPSQPTVGAVDVVSLSSPASGDYSTGANQVMAEFSSTVKDMFSEQDMSMPGPNTVTEVKSITKCIRILSPAKACRSALNQESARN